ncbi:hypothetical protein [Dankookia sp. P2]|uniref:hypothetical protein n=1 Tax=Dankookia sp. P2 TaxID=3423955 RepID=UPI003D6786D0
MLEGGDGCDLLLGQRGNDTLRGGLGDDTLIGAEGEDAMDGNGGLDMLFGGAGNDTLISTDWAALLDGGTGRISPRSAGPARRGRCGWTGTAPATCCPMASIRPGCWASSGTR